MEENERKFSKFMVNVKNRDKGLEKYHIATVNLEERLEDLEE